MKKTWKGGREAEREKKFEKEKKNSLTRISRQLEIN